MHKFEIAAPICFVASGKFVPRVVFFVQGRALHFAAATSQVGALRVLINSKADLRVRVNGTLAVNHVTGSANSSNNSRFPGGVPMPQDMAVPRFDTFGSCCVQRQ